ncbi:MAG: hypothetical protein GY938_17170, partial [Ketobacter sp.]|nr:hypothetical protein [Ketobacter sp.]
MVYRHDSTGGFFSGDAEAQSVNAGQDPTAVQKFSRLSELVDLRGADGRFHFKLVYPAVDISNEWQQTSNPLTTSEAVEGYEAVEINATEQYWGGLAKSSSGATFIDGSIGHGNWFYAIGSNAAHGGGIPGPNATVVTEVELYACGQPLAALPEPEPEPQVVCEQEWVMVYRHDST